MLCVLILDISGGIYSLKASPNDRFFWEIFHGNSFYLLLEFLPEICWEEIAEEIVFVFLFWCLVWGWNPGFMFNKPTYYLLDYGDFSNSRIIFKI